MQKEKPEKYPIDNLIGIEYRKLEKQFSVSQNNLINLAYLLKKAKLLSPISQEAVKLEENIQQKISAIKNSILQEKLLKLQTASGQTSNIYALEKLKRNAEQIKEQIEEHREFSSVLPSYNAFSAAMQTKILSCLNKQPYNSRNSGPPFLIIGITLSLVLAFSALFLLKEYIKSPNKQEQKFEYKQTEQTKTSEIPSVQSYTPISEEHKEKINIEEAKTEETKEQENAQIQWSQILPMQTQKFIYFEQALCSSGKIDVAKKIGYKIVKPNFNLEKILETAYEKSNFNLFAQASQSQPEWYKMEENYYTIHAVLQANFDEDIDTEMAVMPEGKQTISSISKPEYAVLILLKQFRNKEYALATKKIIFPLHFNREISYLEKEKIIIGRFDYCEDNCRFEINIALNKPVKADNAFAKIFSRTLYGSPSKNDPVLVRNWNLVDGMAIFKDLNNDGNYDLILKLRNASIKDTAQENSTNTLTEAFIFNGSSYIKSEIKNIDDLICGQ